MRGRRCHGRGYVGAGGGPSVMTKTSVRSLQPSSAPRAHAAPPDFGRGWPDMHQAPKKKHRARISFTSVVIARHMAMHTRRSSSKSCLGQDSPFLSGRGLTQRKDNCHDRDGQGPPALPGAVARWDRPAPQSRFSPHTVRMLTVRCC